MSYEAWRVEVENGTMADWNEDRQAYDPPPIREAVQRHRVWDRLLKDWCYVDGPLSAQELGPSGRFSRTEV